MTVAKILFEGKKWFNVADSDSYVTANGKKYYPVPSKITIKEGTSITYPSRGTVEAFITYKLEQDVEVECIAANDKYYFYTGKLEKYGYFFSEDRTVGVVLKSDCKNIVWG